ncbi:hypothetical protein [Amantichitinum ursilacus]|uniref:Quinol:cytochrome c oxidoreductase quinone-binding subunit 2 n=1 Tax=Amantichitinum ursilacus TaxID=857265 RepID=A0A0N0GLJ8_9NEIS|nr:hypothetical protein [Amantichitinum ursilacus]KPC50163.1 hypothetical protein WG78_18200 [Amantichitinum ursilacus]
MKSPLWSLAVLLALAVLLFALDAHGFWLAWLVAWWLALGVSLGCLANLCLHDLTGGDWGWPLRPVWQAGVAQLGWIALAGLPLWWAVPDIFAWASPGSSPELARAHWWLNVGFFRARLLFDLLLWCLLGQWQRRTTGRARAGLILLLYGLSITAASFDWIASLQIQWYSTGLGLLVAIGQMLAGMAWAVTMAGGGSARLGRDHGNLLLMYTMSWAYLAFTQFLIIWAENLPDEISWYVPRLQWPWQGLAWLLLLGHFALPFALLLSRAFKQRIAALRALAGWLLLMHALDVLWLIWPSAQPQGQRLWMPLVLLLPMLTLWLTLALRRWPAREVTV